MIVQCPSCASRYRVNEANIPSTGGRIRCPSCEHAFVVYPTPEPSFEDDADDKTSVIMSPDLQEMMAQHQKRFKSKKAPAVEEEEEESMTEVMDPSNIPEMAGLRNFKFGNQPAPAVEDHTMEMSVPTGPGRGLPSFGKSQSGPSDDGHTTELTADALKKGLQAAAAARSGAAPPPLDGRTARIPGANISQNVPAAPRPSQPTRGEPAKTIQSFGKRPAPSYDNAPSAESKSKSGIRFPSEPAGGRSFGEEQISREPRPFSPGPPIPGLGDQDATGINIMAPVMVTSERASDHVGPWHLRTNFGLTYEFPDTKGLRSWLSNRDELDGVTLSADGKEFFELSHFPQTETMAPTVAISAADIAAAAAAAPGFRGAAVPNAAQTGGAAPIAGPGPPAGSAPFPGAAPIAGTAPVAGFGGPQRLTSTPFSTADGELADQNPGFGPGQPSPSPHAPEQGARITPEVYQPPSSGSKMGLLLWPVLIVLIVFAIALVLQTLDIVDIKSAVFGSSQEPSGEQAVAQIVEEPDDFVDQEALLREQEAERVRDARMRDQLDRIILTAEEDIEDNRLQIASEKLETAQTLDPKSVRVHELLVDVYTRLGQAKLAEEASEILAKLRENPLPIDDE